MAETVAAMTCPMGTAHTVMAAEALEKTARIMGHALNAEKQGSVGAQNTLTVE